MASYSGTPNEFERHFVWLSVTSVKVTSPVKPSLHERMKCTRQARLKNQLCKFSGDRILNLRCRLIFVTLVGLFTLGSTTSNFWPVQFQWTNENFNSPVDFLFKFLNVFFFLQQPNWEALPRQYKRNYFPGSDHQIPPPPRNRGVHLCWWHDTESEHWWRTHNWISKWTKRNSHQAF